MFVKKRKGTHLYTNDNWRGVGGEGLMAGGVLNVGFYVICSEEHEVFLREQLGENVEFWEQIMSKDKYSSIFSGQMETTVLIILQIRIFSDMLIPIPWEDNFSMDKQGEGDLRGIAHRYYQPQLREG